MADHNLVIVESPAKAKTLSKYLGKEFLVLASYGHVRDLLPKKGSVDPLNQFHMKYDVIEKNSKHVDKIIKALKDSNELYLATDPDREGEAISWHIYEILKEKKALDGKPIHRVVFHEITRSAIQEALKAPRQISMDLVNAQQARRALDYLVGFNLSPLLWKKVRRGLSAGRVQSPALRLIVEREEEIEKFEAQEYWTIEADLNAHNKGFMAKLTIYANEKIKQFSITNEEQANQIKDTLLKQAQGKLIVHSIEEKQRKRHPAAPFTTSTLQQEAVRKLGFTAQKAMRVAQQLYEGIDIGSGTEGLITYMRTDSVSLAQEAIVDIRDFIQKEFGNKLLPQEPMAYKTKSKNAQEAHEAIRPTSAQRTPKSIESYLTNEQFKLYELIWKRTIACQMLHALINSVSVDFKCGESHQFRATGSTVVSPGFITVYQEGLDDIKEETHENHLPPLKKGETVNLNQLRPEQHFTEPPPRYTEASLVKALEEHGIGRPSTYAPIISTLQQREYVLLDKKKFTPTDVGRIVNRFLTQHFNQYVDYEFTANLEDQLDAISRGEKTWIPLLDDFWKPFNELIHTIEQNVKRSDVTTETLKENCPKCGKPIAIRLGRRGRFIGCTGFPDCDYTRDLNENESTAEPEIVENRSCPNCQSPLVIKSGKYGKFLGCSSYPTCKYMEPVEKPKDTGVTCPICKEGQMLQRKSRRGKIFFSCSKYPDCKYALWNEPINESCSQCKWPILTIKITKSKGTEKVCPQKECGHSEQVSPPSG